jgi:hypothetical protein
LQLLWAIWAVLTTVVGCVAVFVSPATTGSFCVAIASGVAMNNAATTTSAVTLMANLMRVRITVRKPQSRHAVRA